jgi:hypothetical protein
MSIHHVSKGPHGVLMTGCGGDLGIIMTVIQLHTILSKLCACLVASDQTRGNIEMCQYTINGMSHEYMLHMVPPNDVYVHCWSGGDII